VGEQFAGTVRQVRLQPTVVSNVTTYSAIIDAPNPDLKLKPGMTANLKVEVERRSQAVRIPNAALRFRPATATLAAFHQIAPATDTVRVRGQGLDYANVRSCRWWFGRVSATG
jgi:HlyD family secretion protein